MYNVPARTGLNLELSTIEKIINSNPFVFGIKESTCDINRIIKLHKICKDKIAIYSGEDDLNFLFYCLGGNGTISVTANAYCKQVKEVFSACANEKLKLGLSKQNLLSNINSLMFCETNPVPIKYALHKLNIISSPQVRMPLVQLEISHKAMIDETINRP